MSTFKQQTKLIDCERSADADHYRELFVVEGDSASLSVARAADRRFQAVLPLQGKPMNASKASDAAIRRNPWFGSLMSALGMDWRPAHNGHLHNGYLPDDQRPLRSPAYNRVLLLFDPDADGIHCGALTMMFFDRYLGSLIETNRLSMIQPPRFNVTAQGYEGSLQAFSDDHLAKIRQSLTAKGIRHRHQRYRGLASIDQEILSEYCLDPASRTSHLIGRRDVQEVCRVFGYARPT